MPGEADLAIARQWVAKARNDLINADAERLRDALVLRYPDDGPAPSVEVAREARDASEEVLGWLEGGAPQVLR